MRFKQTLFPMFVGLVLGVFVMGAQQVWAERGDEQALPLEDLQLFSEVYTRIKQSYVEDVDDGQLLRDAIRGMLSGLDPHSNYLDAKDYEDLQVGTKGEFGGLGIEVGMENGFVKVIAPIDDTPAAEAGVKAGDLIIRLDGKPVKGMSLGEAVALMRGEPGSEIIITVVREGRDAPFDITITRAVIQVKSVKARQLEPGYAYLRITSFQNRTGPNLRDAISEIKTEHGGPLKGVVLDLRNNPGGVLNAAVDVADVFLEKGIIVYTEGRIESAEMSFNAQPGDMIDDAPLVVLVNGGSASASEIVAGALQDHGRGIIMGERTFGKGSVQTILPLPERGTGLKLTTARYYTPAGRSIQAEGIVPDVALQSLALTKKDMAIGPLKEADLEGHLDNDTSNGESGLGVGPDNGALAADDFVLYEALNMLKALHIQASRKAAKG